jgi:hypothetical protein
MERNFVAEHRAVARLALFEKDADYEAFERVLAEAMEKHPTRLLDFGRGEITGRSAVRHP